KAEAMERLPELLAQFEEQFTARGGTVHWARDAAEANRIVEGLVRATGSSEVVKVKSMATQEIREAGSSIKAEAMERLPELLAQFEEQFTARGGTVHWARDAA
ncbi:hypothetical protein CTI14_59480, partial [Methylobacterium radiotolerans]